MTRNAFWGLCIGICMASTQSVAQKIENTNIQTDNQKNYTPSHINEITNGESLYTCLLYTSPSPRDVGEHLVCRLLLEKNLFLMIRRPPRSTLGAHRRQRQMCIRDSFSSVNRIAIYLSLIHISEPTRRRRASRMPSSA